MAFLKPQKRDGSGSGLSRRTSIASSVDITYFLSLQKDPENNRPNFATLLSSEALALKQEDDTCVGYVLDIIEGPKIIYVSNKPHVRFTAAVEFKFNVSQKALFKLKFVIDSKVICVVHPEFGRPQIHVQVPIATISLEEDGLKGLMDGSAERIRSHLQTASQDLLTVHGDAKGIASFVEGVGGDMLLDAEKLIEAKARLTKESGGKFAKAKSVCEIHVNFSGVKILDRLFLLEKEIGKLFVNSIEHLVTT